MERKEIFSRFKDYNNELEKVLETKKFPEASKNLLLSILYKVEASYKDYAKVRVDDRTKKEFIEEIIENIQNNCKEIEIVDAKNKKTSIIKNESKIVSYANEREILKAIIQISIEEISTIEEYFYLKQPFNTLYSLGLVMNNIEVIRDFDGWSWNIQKSQIDNFDCNLLFQNLRILYGSKDINKLLLEKQYIDKLKTNKKERLLIQMILGVYIRLNIENKVFIEKLQEKVKNEAEEMKDKIILIDKITKEKKKYTKEIKSMDETINNRQLLIDEYKKRNLKAKPENRIFCISDLVDIIEKERDIVLKKIAELNKKIEPEKYVQQKEILENAEHVLTEALSKEENEWNKLKIDFQSDFLKHLLIKLQKVNTKKEILDFIYLFRYYLYIPINQEESIKDIKELEKQFENLFYIIIKKACKLKLISAVHDDPKINSEILKSLFYVKVIDLEDVEIELEKEEDKLKVIICEHESIDNIRRMKLEQEENLKIKYNKRIKIFN